MSSRPNVRYFGEVGWYVYRHERDDQGAHVVYVTTLDGRRLRLQLQPLDDVDGALVAGVEAWLRGDRRNPPPRSQRA